MPFEIVRNDVTKMRVDAIVCNGNRSLERRDGVCGAVFTAAGPELARYCAGLAGCDTGAAVVTPGFDLPAKYIIHTVGPRWNGGQSGEEEILRCCYRNVLAAAVKYRAASVATPLIASGRYGYPKEEALRVAGEEIRGFLAGHEELKIYLVVYDPKATLLSHALQAEIREFITGEEYEAYHKDRRIQLSRRESAALPASLSEALRQTGPEFREVLQGFVDQSGRKWSEVYNDALVTRAVASKIQTRPGYKPSKGTALAFAIALRLNLGETERLLRSFGAALSPADRTDVIVKYFIIRGNYDRMELDMALFDNGEPCLTGNI